MKKQNHTNYKNYAETESGSRWKERREEIGGAGIGEKSNILDIRL